VPPTVVRKTSFPSASSSSAWTMLAPRPLPLPARQCDERQCQQSKERQCQQRSALSAGLYPRALGPCSAKHYRNENPINGCQIGTKLPILDANRTKCILLFELMNELQGIREALPIS
jgi:hypothetical protein